MPTYKVHIHLEGGGVAAVDHDASDLSYHIDKNLDAQMNGSNPYIEFRAKSGTKDGLIQVLKTKVIGWSIQEVS
jgi:hypothetical protein